MTALFDACKNGDLTQVNLLLVQGIDATADNNAAIREAAYNGHLTIVERLLREPAVDATADKNEVISWAAVHGHFDIVDRLLELKGLDLTARNNEAFRLAAMYGHLSVVNRLLEVPWVDATSLENFAIRWAAASNGGLAVVDIICETLRLQIVSDFYTVHRNENLREEEEKSLGIDFLKENLITVLNKKLSEIHFMQYDSVANFSNYLKASLPINNLQKRDD